MLTTQKSSEEKKQEEKEKALVEQHYWIIKKDITKTEERSQQKNEFYNKSDVLATEISKSVLPKIKTHSSSHIFLKRADTILTA